MNLKINLHSIAGLFVFVIVGIVGYYIFRTESSPYELQVMEVEGGGYGYKITRDEKIIVYQPFIPGLNTKKPFVSGKEAYRVGAVVRERLEANESISISVDDLCKMRISGCENNISD